jgi:hypothetical protein
MRRADASRQLIAGGPLRIPIRLIVNDTSHAASRTTHGQKIEVQILRTAHFRGLFEAPHPTA